jgi:MraZ protein
MEAFLSTYSAKLDEKGRVFVPSHFRKIIPEAERDKVVMRKDTKQNCFIVYPQHVWEKIIADFRQKFNGHQYSAALAAFTGRVEVMDIDGQGRILLKKGQLAQIGIENPKDAMLAFEGRIDIFAIWNNANIEEERMSDSELDKLLDEVM